MKLFKTLIIFSALFLSLNSWAQSGASYKAQADGWLVDFEEAKAISSKTGKPIMANFTGSDWCGWCKRLKREVFDKAEFKSWAAENVVLLELDFPRRTRIPQEIQQQNAALQRAFKVRGYPAIWVFDLAESTTNNKSMINAYGKTGYVKGVSSKWIAEANRILANGQ